MNFRAVVLAVGLAVLPMAVSGAESAIIGTWKQVLSKSKYQPGPAPTISSTVRIEAVEGGEKLSVEGIGADGQPASWSYTATYDGKPASVTGSPYGDTLTLKQIDAHKSMITYTRNGKVSRTSTRTMSQDGKTLTITAKGTNASGQAYNNVTVFEKQ
jgi:hypothetical protein